MWIDITHLNRFYKSDLGMFTRNQICDHISDLWPCVKDERILGLGYAPPFLQAFASETAYLTAAMPSYQGASPWPSKAPSKTVLVLENQLPFQDQAFDKSLLIHVMGYTVHMKEMLREVWRTLADNGEVIIVVPNRFGFWSHMDKTPFGKAMPYTGLHLKHILIESCFAPVQTRKLLYTPPVHSDRLLKILTPVETVFQRWIGFAPGVIMVKALKQVYAPLKGKPAQRWARALAPTPKSSTPFDSWEKTVHCLA